MARLYAGEFVMDRASLPPGRQRELDVVERLVAGLPETWHVLQSIPWLGVSAGHVQLGEWDIVVVSPAGHLAILEVKAGEVKVEAGRLVKHYGASRKSVDRQSRLQHQAMISKLKAAGIDVWIGHLLVLPDVVVDEAIETAAYHKSRLVDAATLPHMPTFLTQWLRSEPPDAAKVEAVLAFLHNELRISISPQAFVADLRAQQAALLASDIGALARLHLPPGGRLAVEAVAGAGKTELALAWLAAAAARGERWQYLCFNRPLADALRLRAPQWKDRIATLHELAIGALRRRGQTPDFCQPQQTFAAAMAALAADGTWAAGLCGVILDEAQDFASDWVAALRAGLAEPLPELILYDPDQAVLPHVQAEATPWWQEAGKTAVRIRLTDNFRNPRALVDALIGLELTQRPLRARHPMRGVSPDFHVVPDGDAGAMRAASEHVLAEWFAQGVPPEQIAVLCFPGWQRSHLIGAPQLAGTPTRRYLGRFDAEGKACESEGSLQLETVLRFKGQSAPYVLVTEIDWERLDLAARRKLYVALTRAEWQAAFVITERAARSLLHVLEQKEASA